MAEKKLLKGDANLQVIQDSFYPILSIIRYEKKHSLSFSVLDEIVIEKDGEELLRLPISIFADQASKLLSSLQEKPKGAFSLPDTEQFLNEISCQSLKASSSVKSDITIKVHDHKTGFQPTLGFSIKSQLGSPSTLLNAGKTTNFIFRVNNLEKVNIEELNSINSRSKIRDRIDKAKELGASFSFVSTEQEMLGSNLTLIDSLLPEILAEALLLFYSTKASKVSEIIDELEELNPLIFKSSSKHQFYTYKTKRFLTDVALGMMPSKVWTGLYDATGGYLVVKEDGDVLCYHLHDRNHFENYLLANTKFDTASTGRHGFGEFYEENNEIYIKLNLQIRFIK